MNGRRASAVAAAAALAALSIACSGGGGEDVLDAALVAGFTADTSPGAPGSVSAQLGSASDDVVAIDVILTDTPAVFSVAFDLVYDRQRAEYLSAEEGTLLDVDGAATQFLVSDEAGRLVVGATRLQDPGGTIPDVDATGAALLATFRFRAREAGTSRVDFDDAQPRSVKDHNGVERPVSWSGGALVAR
jgi:hypothetical protein